jgi:polyisoprenoid-binding protein YceI
MAAPAASQTWTIDSQHSSASFAVRHMSVSFIRGDFEKMTGTVDFDGKDISKARVNAEIDVASIRTRVLRRDEHLKAADILDAASFPTITFRSKRIEPAGAGRFRMTGDLTLHGVTKEVVLTGDGPAKPFLDPKGTLYSGATATGTINRRDFGINYGAIFDGAVEIADEVQLTLDIQLRQKVSP